jgi:histidyl-tRNA synthetase
VQESSDVLLVNFGEKEAGYALLIDKKLKNAGIRSELYPDNAKMKKQMKYADQKGIKYVLLIGAEEMESGIFSLKNMKEGDQVKGSLDEIISIIKS